MSPGLRKQLALVSGPEKLQLTFFLENVGQIAGLSCKQNGSCGSQLSKITLVAERRSLHTLAAEISQQPSTIQLAVPH